MALILGIESSCDETAAAVVEDGKKVLSNAISSQIAKHAPYGGVIPELAAREHLTAVVPVCEEALRTAGVGLEDISAVAVTHAPGLIPALLVGINFAKGLAGSRHLPLIGINHFLAHICGTFLDDPDHSFDDPSLYPIMALVVSGGHTSIVILRTDGVAHLAGTTLDDAAGEAFDKAAKLLDLGYPGGPVIERLAKNGDPAAYRFPRSLTGSAGKPLAEENRYHFSFSGLKTALLYHVNRLGGADKVQGQLLADTLASYQDAITDVLCRKAFDAALRFGARTAILCGGVACNSALRTRFLETAPRNLQAIAAPKRYCTDNGAMAAGLGWHYFRAGIFAGPDLDAKARLPLETKLPFRFDRA